MHLKTVKDYNGRSLPIMSYDDEASVRIVAPSGTATAPAPFDAGAYLITSNADVYLSFSGAAGDTEGSIFLAAGMMWHRELPAGRTISAMGATSAASIFIVPLV